MMSAEQSLIWTESLKRQAIIKPFLLQAACSDALPQKVIHCRLLCWPNEVGHGINSKLQVTKKCPLSAPSLYTQWANSNELLWAWSSCLTTGDVSGQLDVMTARELHWMAAVPCAE